VPTRPKVEAESQLKQADKAGVEVDQGILANQFLADPECGRHLCHAMLLPRPESADALAKFRRDGRLDLGTARVERQGKAAVLLLSNKRFLNAEDNATQTATEIGADVCILDPDRPGGGAARRRGAGGQSMPAAACSTPASTSRISTTARFRSCGS
jgi:thioesterase DpgC